MKTTSLCRIELPDTSSGYFGFPSSGSSIHILPPEFTEWPRPQVRIVRLEVTQGLQNWNNDLTLVRNRKTVVRAFVETDRGSQQNITAILEGRKLASDDSLIWKDTTRPVNPSKSIIAKPDAAARRADINSSLNFRLPENWTDLEENQTLELELKFDYDENVNCNNRCLEEVEFTEVNPPEIFMIPVPIKNVDDIVMVPSSGMLTAQMNRIKSVLPFSDFKFSIRHHFKSEEAFDFGTKVGDIIEIIEKEVAKDDRDAVYLGVLMGDGEDNDGDVGGTAFLGYEGGRSASWYIYGIDGLLPEPARHFGQQRNYGAHELGHILGLHHTSRIRDKLDDKGEKTEEKEEVPICGESGKSRLHDPIVEIDYYIPGSTENGKIFMPGLGPLGNRDLEVWGTDTRYVGFSHRGAFAYKTISEVLSVIDPKLVFSLMSYCPAVAESAEEDGKGKFVQCVIMHHSGNIYAPECEFHRGGQGSWLDSSRHEYLVRCLSARTCLMQRPDVDVAETGKGFSAVSSDLFTGSILLSSEGDPTGAVFDPVFSRPRLLQSSATGEYVLELRDDAGAVLQSTPFSALRDSDGDMEGEAVFSVLLPSLPDYDSFAVVKSGTELAVVNRSLNAPSVSISGITNGHQFKFGDSIDLSWTATDADGDDLTFKLYYSTDGGNNYRVLSRPTTNTRETFHANSLEGSDTARIGISVSDGTRSSFSQTPVFSVAKHMPQVRIETPSTGAVFAERQGFILEASGYDIEDGSLPSSSFTWRSNLDGELGKGSFLVKSAADLSQGTHTIAVTATDSDNMASTASVDITIARRNMLPVANDDEAFGGLEETLQIDVLANDIDTEGDFDLSTLTIDSRPRLGIAEVVMTEMGRPAIEYSPITGGEDTFSYYICDCLYRCDTAEVTVVFPDCTITGTRGRDNLVGTSVADVICGLDGDDIIDGKGGNDLIYAGFGEDLVYGRTGDDTIYGGAGDDTIRGNAGADTIYPGSGVDTVLGVSATDTVLER